jgi:hypothetical protein
MRAANDNLRADAGEVARDLLDLPDQEAVALDFAKRFASLGAEQFAWLLRKLQSMVTQSGGAQLGAIFARRFMPAAQEAHNKLAAERVG